MKRLVLQWAARHFLSLAKQGRAGYRELHSYGIEDILSVADYESERDMPEWEESWLEAEAQMEHGDSKGDL